MNKKGYTLVELIGVVVLLAILITLVTTSIVKVIKASHKTMDDATKKLLYNQASAYLSKHEDITANGAYSVSISDLIKDDKLSTNFLDNYDETEITLNSCIVINYTQGVATYQFELECSD